MSLRTIALLLVVVIASGSLWHAIDHGSYQMEPFAGRAHMTITMLAIVAFCASWVLDERRFRM